MTAEFCITCCADGVCCWSSGSCWVFGWTVLLATDGECVEWRAEVAGDEGRDSTLKHTKTNQQEMAVRFVKHKLAHCNDPIGSEPLIVNYVRTLLWISSWTMIWCRPGWWRWWSSVMITSITVGPKAIFSWHGKKNFEIFRALVWNNFLRWIWWWKPKNYVLECLSTRCNRRSFTNLAEIVWILSVKPTRV